MGIIALKAMAKGPWPNNSDRTKYPKLWYEPLNGNEEIRMGLRFTLSHPVTTLLTPGDADLFRTALALRDELQPLRTEEVDNIKTKALKQNPLFRYSA